MAHRRSAHEDGAWVREAAAAYADKRRTAAAAGAGRMSADSRHEWPLWEVFIRAKRGVSHVHAGSLHAPDAEMALRNARDIYTRRQEGVSIWVVEAERASPPAARTRRTRSSSPPATRSTGTRRFYDVPEGVEHL